MAKIPQRFIDDLLDRVDIVDVVSSRIDLRKSGKNYSARCPFHNEKTPSFTVSPDKQFYYCFGCGAGGNAIGFVMDNDHLAFVDAVEVLAQQAGMEVPRESTAEAHRDGKRRKLYAILAEADKYYQEQLRKHQEADSAVTYLRQRGLSGEIARTFGIGFAPPGWDNLINRICLDDSDVALLVEAGLAIRKDDDSSRVYDRFRNRIMFPIRDTRGRTIGFGGRVLDDSKPKYLNSPETPVFHKGRELYGLHEAHRELRESSSLLVVEGYMDVVALAQHGIHNAVATLGTAATSDHLDKLFRYTSEVIFCFDGDDAGRKAARRALETTLPVMADGRGAYFLFLPDGEDPDSLVRKLGREGFQKLMASAQPLSDFIFAVLQDGLDTSTLQGKARLSQLAAPMINRIGAGVFRQLMLKELARRTDMDVETLAAIHTPVIATPASPPEEMPPGLDDYQDLADSAPPEPGDHYGDYWEPQPSPQRQQRRVKMPALERLIHLLLHHPELRSEVVPLPDLGPLDDGNAKILADLCALLEHHPHYTLNHILGYWRGVHGADGGEILAQIAAADMLAAAGDTRRDNIAEIRDILVHLQRQLEQSQPPRQQLEALLAKAKLTADDRKRVSILQNKLSAEDRNELYQLIKQSLATANR